MARCKDPALTYLNQQGYNVVKLPRAGIRPLDVLGRDGKTIERLGSLDRLWKSDVEAPLPAGPLPAGALSGQQTSDLKLSIGLKFLSDVLGAMGAAMPQIGFAYQGAKVLQFTIGSVQTASVDPFVMGDFLSEGDLNTNNPFVVRYFEDEGTDAYVIFEVLTSGSITVSAKRNRSTELQVDVPAIQDAVGGNIKMEASSEGSKSVTYKGVTPLTFGFKAFDIEFDNGRWSVEALKPDAGSAFDASTVRSDLDTEGYRVSIK